VTLQYSYTPLEKLFDIVRSGINDNIISLAKKVNKNTKTAYITLLRGGFSSQVYKVSPEDFKRQGIE
jgi:hypothetical protein